MIATSIKTEEVLASIQRGRHRSYYEVEIYEDTML